MQQALASHRLLNFTPSLVKERGPDLNLEQEAEDMRDALLTLDWEALGAAVARHAAQL